MAGDESFFNGYFERLTNDCRKQRALVETRRTNDQ